ncbi:MAG TPA: hypothetical protein PK636_03740 [bacterium]|nr:hypothetical protein [bacterium]HPJ71778.1 hypothetical protein [bacterium]HPQ65393.1 hypothetical protein [bacterium]
MINDHESVDALRRDPDFSDFFTPLDTGSDFVDATYFLRRDGTLVFSEGYYHEFEKPLRERRLISHIVYTPIPADAPAPAYTRKTLFGRLFENITKEIMATNPLDRFYPLQLRRYIDLDPAQAGQARQVYSRYKAMVPVSELEGAFPTLHSLQTIIGRSESDPAAENIRVVTEQTAALLGIDPRRIGISGSLSLGCYDDPHDLDFVIYGTADEVAEMVGFMRGLTDREERRRVYESGKFWPIRFWDYHGDDRFMVCPFFSYLDPERAPLRDFECEELGGISFRARIADDTHNAFNPTVLGLEDTRTEGPGAGEVSRLILYHGGERGDWRKGDRVEGTGTRCRMRTFRKKNGVRAPAETFSAVVVNNLDQVHKIEGDRP